MQRTMLLVVLLGAALNAQSSTDVQHAFLDIDINPGTQTITGSVTWDVVSNVAGLSSFTLQLHGNFSVSAVAVNGVPVGHTRPPNAVTIPLSPTYGVGQPFTVSLSYVGVPPINQGFGSFSFGNHGSPPAPVIASFSVPSFAHTWWPCKESLTDKFTTKTYVTVPDTLVAACNGALQGTDVLPGNRKRYRWLSNYPIATYGVSVTASNYQIRSDTYPYAPGVSMPVDFYIYPENWASSQTDLDRIIPMLTVFSSKFGPYPFANEKYGICQYNSLWGMEHQTISSQPNFFETLSAHELAHSWWGNSITCATWNDVGLNEGFATYLEAIWDEFKPAGGSTAGYFARMNANRPPNPLATGSVYVTTPGNLWDLFNTVNVYWKGSWVLHQLRHVVGDTAFFQIMNDYRAAKQYSSATWVDFATIATTSWGQDLTWLINQCVMRTGAPAYQLSWSNRVIGGQNFVFGNIMQTQAASAYRFPIDIKMTTATGQSTTGVVWNDQKRDDFVLPMNGPATSLTLDPAPWILKGPTTSGSYAQSLTASTQNIPWTGGTATFNLDAGPSNANRPYVLGASSSGISPGITFTDGKVLPLVFDAFTLAVYQNMSAPFFQNFSGFLDANGQATAQLIVPNLGTGTNPIVTQYAFLTLAPGVFVSNPVVVSIP